MPRYLSLALARAPEGARAAPTPARLADWCRRFTPLAAADAPDGAMLDIAGAAHLFGGETALMADIERRLARHGLSARAAVADTPEAAWALARHGDVVRAIPVDADEKTLRRLLGGFPVAALRLPPDIALALSQAGLKRIDDILLRPRAPIAARFGEHVFVRLDGLMGRARSPIAPRFEAPAYVVERRFAEPISRVEDIRAVIAGLAVDLGAMLERHGEGARRLEASLFRVDGAARPITVGASRPLRAPATIALLFDERVKAASEQRADDPFDSGYGFDLVRLCALEVETLRERTDDLLSERAQAAGAANRALPDLVDRLGARLGTGRVTRLAPRDTHIPEFAVASVPAARREKFGDWPVAGATALAIAPRPLRLFERPEPVEALAEVPDGPPLRFRWRRVTHEVVAIEGPERIAPEWWKGAAWTRDYFRVEDAFGARFWLYREGLYGVETTRPRWFMHGLFA